MRRRTYTMGLRLLSGWWERLRGLLGTGRDAPAVLIDRCASVHTFGMAYPLDLLFLDPSCRVLRSYRAVPANRVVSARGARAVVERPACSGPWPQAGDRIDVKISFKEKRGDARWRF
ncbi:MAG: DUF192 domain-containing protein [Eggerthellaceae bacterium]|nr:DUF192 domain-containing protein [Eggerthellaceae bacterium]